MLATVQIAGKNGELAIAIHHNLAHLAAHVMHTILFYGTTIKLVKALARGAHINIENSYIHVGIFFTNVHRVFSIIHATNLAAIGFAPLRSITGTNAGHNNDLFRLLARGGAHQMTFCRSGCVGQALQLQGRNNILALAPA